MTRFLAIPILYAGCGPQVAPAAAPATAHAEAPVRHAAPAPPAEPAIAAEPMSEAAGRAVLAERFRRAGWRIVYDVPIERGGATLTVDGYDPDRQIGFEYVDTSERGSDLDDAERAALAGSILIVDAADAETVGRLADAFLARQRAGAATP